MFRQGSPRLPSVLGALCLLLASSAALAQIEEPLPPPDLALEEYLEQRGLRDLLIAHLLRRLRASEGPQRAELAERLGGYYVQMLDEAVTAEQRRQWEARAVELLEAVPEAESMELRLNLAKARYLHAEDIAERHRLRLASPEESQEAQTTLRSVNATLKEMGTMLTRRVDRLEQRESAARDEEAPRIRAELAEARRLRSLAMYYGGWSLYYTALLSGRSQLAEEALSNFGWLLNTPGRAASVERIAPDALRYEHLARAAIGCALSESLRGRDGVALLWLHALDSAVDLPDSVKQQLLARRIVILTSAKRWADLEQAVRRRRLPVASAPVQPLIAAEARLLAVLMLEALHDPAVVPAAHEAIQRLADAAITDLITLGEARHVHDLVSRYGTALLSGEGFIVQYVRGLHAYEAARQAHAAGENDQQPTRRAEVANLYAAALQVLENASQSRDASRFPAEQSNALMLGALCLFYSARLEQAADRFEQTHRLAPATAQGEDALWMAIVALDRAVDGGRLSLKERLNRLATFYLQRYPSGDRAAMLIMRLSSDGVISRERAAEILLAIGRESPLYEAARRHAADLLYAIYRRSRGSDRDFAALRFAEISDELLALDLPQIDPSTEQGQERAQRAIVRLRQVLDAVLGMTAPDLARAERALEHIQTLARRGGVDLKIFEDELAFRQLQVALLRGRQEEADRWLARLHALGGRYGDSADRLLYQRALVVFRRTASLDSASEVVRHGSRVIGQFGSGSAAMADPVVQSLYDNIAEAAARLWRARGDQTHLQLVLRLDRALVEHQRASAPVLRRYAELAEAAGEDEAALEAWRTLMSALNAGTSEWFEARYHSLRLLAAAEPQRAREVIEQLRVLYPNFGPEPWSTRLHQLDKQLEGAGDGN
jgi:hypothetical protein